MDRYEKLFDRNKNIKYRVGDFIRLNENLEYFYLAEVLKVNDEMEIPDYYIQTFKKCNNEIVKFWADDNEILRKVNSKEKQFFKKKKIENNI